MKSKIIKGGQLVVAAVVQYLVIVMLLPCQRIKSGSDDQTRFDWKKEKKES